MLLSKKYWRVNMAFFGGKSEEQLKAWQKDLEDQEKKLKEIEVNQKRKGSALAGQDKSLKKMIAEQTKKEADLAQIEQELKKKEIEAKNGFAKQKRESFKEVIETQWEELKKESKILDEKQRIIDEKLSDLFKREADIVKHERVTQEERLKAENGFADLDKISLRELEKRENTCLELEDRLRLREDNLQNGIEESEKKKEIIRKRENELEQAEIIKDAGFTDERKKLNEDLIQQRNAFEQEISEQRQKHYEELGKDIKKERTARLKTLEKELSDRRDILKNNESSLKAEISSEKEELSTRKADVESKIDEFTSKERLLEAHEDRLEEREKSLDTEIDRRILEHKNAYEKENKDLRKEIKAVINSRTSLKEILDTYEQLRNDLGDEPEKVKAELYAQVDILKGLREELAKRPTSDMQIEYDRLKKEIEVLSNACKNLSFENISIKKKNLPKASLEMKIAELEAENKSLHSIREIVEKDNNRQKELLDRYLAAYESNQNESDRILSIEAPYIKKKLPRDKNEVSEIVWLNSINDSCIEYGLRFPRRILHAFHTALKTSEWSPLTILAGVSGTGKSELPRLYSHFGGLNFMSLAVQPNWDSKESMLGFFNSIDNKFDAQPVLRLLAQSQKNKSSEYPFGLADTMVLILMDEMNLAHIEMYFAEFLSKLELRRGLSEEEVPNIDVNIGAGVEPYHLPIGRNVLWTGTMNQDETTKSLSDKVLDRGIIINFPRPIHLERRKKLNELPEQLHLLKRSTWNKWWIRETSFTDEQISPFIGFVEEMNESLAKVGRALGHRVWQSIEYYMSNYPAVLLAKETGVSTLLKKAMKIAFEDQLVQKVMPKMQGIETTGTSKSECLDKIRAQLDNSNYSIIEDFDISCKVGYGQFSWKSANYITEENEDDVLEQILNQCASLVKKNPSNPSSINSKESISVEKKSSTKAPMSKVKESKGVEKKNLTKAPMSKATKGTTPRTQQDVIKDIIPKELIRYSETFNIEISKITVKEIKRVANCTLYKAAKIKEAIKAISN